MLRPTIEMAFAALVACLLPATASANAPLTAERVQPALECLDELAHQALTSTGVPGIAIAVVHGDKVVFKKGFGVREAGKPEPIDADTVFQLASVSKPLATTVLAALVSEGTIGWDDRVIDHDPDFRLYDPFVTRECRLRDLLCHRSGLPDHCGDLLEDIGYSRQEILRRLRYQPPASSFRTGYAYTNFGFSEAAFAVALARGKPWEELAANELFVPLGMTSTSYRFVDYDQAPNRALLHVKVDGQWVPRHVRQPDAQAPAGGACSTLNDMVRWLRLHLNHGQWEGKPLIAPTALNETRSPQFVLGFHPDQGRLGSYGLGWNVSIERGGRVFWKHSGAFSLGVRTQVALLPSEGLGIAVFSNAAPTGIPEGLTESFFDLVLDGQLQRDWIEFANRMFDEEIQRELDSQTDYSQPLADRMPALALSAYTGQYANDFFGTIEIAAKQGGLVLRLGPKPIEFRLTHWDRDVFIYQPEGEMAGGPAGLRFAINPHRQAESVLIENLNVHGQGTFTRQQ